MPSPYDYSSGSGYARARADWADFPSTTTPIQQTHLDRIDQAIYDLKLAVYDVRDFGAVGDNVADDTAEVQAAIAAANPSSSTHGGIVYFPPGRYLCSGTLTIPRHVHLVGAGKGEFTSKYGVSTIRFSHNGQGILVDDNIQGWSIRDLAITGDTTQASQDLLVLGTDASPAPAQQGEVQRVFFSEAGRDNIVINGGLQVHFNTCHSHSATRYGLLTSGIASNLKFTKTNFRSCKQWGVVIGGGAGIHFDTCTIESNSLHASVAYGGLKLDPNDANASANIQVTMTSCWFENNDGPLTTGVPISIVTGTRAAMLNEVGTFYSENTGVPCTFASGTVTSFGIITNITTHATVTTAEPVVFVNPNKFGAGVFAVTDTGKVTRVMGSESQFSSLASAATLTLPAGCEVASVTGSTTVTSITASHPGRRVTIVWAASATFDVTDGSNLKMAGSITAHDADDTLNLVCDGTNWLETGRSVN